jgi:hypothetical protein
VTIEQCMEYNIAKLTQRYGKSFSAEKSWKRYTE